MRSRLPLTALLLAAACGGASASDRVSVMAVDRLSGELGAQDVELPGTDLTAVRGPAGIVLLDGTRTPDCQLRRKVSGSLVAQNQNAYSGEVMIRRVATRGGPQAVGPITAEQLVPRWKGQGWQPFGHVFSRAR